MRFQHKKKYAVWDPGFSELSGSVEFLGSGDCFVAP